jgi:peptidoglycan/LPS O-acetylase OafA/YrhL
MSASSIKPAEGTGEASTGSTRDEFIDLCRAFSLLVVVVWHWVFTIVVWRSRGPSANSPLGFTDNLWILTWVLQVMPVFFFVGGYAHLQLWSKRRSSGASGASFVLGRVRRLLAPALALLVVWVAIAAVAEGVFHAYWFGRAALLIVSPLWFIAVYLALVLLAPLAIWLHQRFGPLIVVMLVGLAALVDVLRFGRHVEWAALLNLVLVWGLCHQLGFFYQTLADGPRILAWCFVWGGLFGLVGLVLTNIYPPSMVGVPGDRISNMGPPTLCIVALCFFQTGLVMLVRPWVLERLRRPGWARANEVVNRFALPLFLFHTTGYAIAFALLWLAGYRPPDHPTPAWWAQRPIWLVVPLVCTIPVILLFGRQWTAARRQVAPPAPPPAAAQTTTESRW